MKKFPIAEVEAGEVVARPVVTPSGVVLMQPGAVLTADLVGRLHQLGVEAVWLQGTGVDAEQVEKDLTALDRRFENHQQDPLMMELKAIVARCIRQGAADERDG